tara:strand:- start:399 stop:815 length:417 start_codon:yes stop_codon:yes gene_type:complete
MKNFKLELDLITDICEQQLGLEVGTLNTKTKTKDLVLGRMVVSNILMDGGVTPTKLSDHYVQHRTCFYHYGKLHKQYMMNARIYPEYNELYSMVLAQYEESTECKMFSTTFKKMSIIDDIENTILELQESKKLLTETI